MLNWHQSGRAYINRMQPILEHPLFQFILYPRAGAMRAIVVSEIESGYGGRCCAIELPRERLKTFPRRVPGC